MHCNCYFLPDKYNYHTQLYCSKSECRHASRIASRRKYRRKDKNRTPEERQKESERVKKWQKNNPGYKKRQKISRKNKSSGVLRDIAPAQNSILRDIAQLKKEISVIPGLQRNIHYYQCVTTGLASMLSGDVLREIIGGQLDRYYDIGRNLISVDQTDIKTNILDERSSSYEKQSSDQCREKTADSKTFQLGGSSFGP